MASRNIWMLSFVSLINDLSSKIILPLLPFFIVSLGGTGLAVGLVHGASEMIVSFMKIASGHIADRVNAKRLLVGGGYLLSAAFKLLFAFASSWPAVLFFRSGERLGKGLRAAPADSLISDSAKKGEKGAGFGFHRAFDSGALFWGQLSR